MDRSAFAHCTVALKQAQRGWYIHRLLQNFLRRFSSLAGVLQTPTRARPRNKKVSFDLPRNYLRAGRSRSGHARHLRSDALHFPNVHAPRFQRPSDAASGSKKARSVAKISSMHQRVLPEGNYERAFQLTHPVWFKIRCGTDKQPQLI